jgi:type IV/VI secretion system ImpK/VasF family protein
MHLVDCFVDVFSHIKQVVSAEPASVSDAQLREKVDHLFASSAHLAEEGGYQDHHYNAAKFAVVAWLDEQVLGSDLELRDSWRSQLAQQQYFNTVSAGQLFFDELHKLDQFDSFDMDVREVYFYCLAFGFHGKYYTDAGLVDLAKIKQENYQMLKQSKGDLGKQDHWFDQSALANSDSTQEFKSTGWALMLGLPLLGFTGLIAWYRIDLLNTVEHLIKSF